MPAPSDLVHQQSITTGTGDLTLTAVNGKRTFLTAFGTGGTNTFDYYISNRNAAEWERGTGHENAGTLVRDTVLASSNAGVAVNFSAGLKDVTNDVPAANQARLDAANIFTADQTITSTDAGPNLAPRFNLDRDSSSPAAFDSLGGLVFVGRSTTDAEVNYGVISGIITDPTNGAEISRMQFNVMVAGVSTNKVQITSNGITVAGIITMPGSTSGQVNVTPQAVAGAPTLTLPNTTGTFAVGASAPLALSTTTGNMSWTGAAFTKTDDTNVTATLGGSPTTAVGTAMSLTLGWTGTLSVARGGTAAASAQEAAKSLGIPWVLAQSYVASSLTGATGPTTLATVTVPGNSMGANGVLRIRALWSCNNDASVKTARVRFNATLYSQMTLTSLAAGHIDVVIGNRNNTSSQVGGMVGETTWSSTTAVATSAHDTTSNKDIIFTAELADSADTLTLEGYIVEVLYKA